MFQTRHEKDRSRVSTNYIFLKLSSLACRSVSIPPSSIPDPSACATLLVELGAATADDGAFTSCTK